MPTIDLTQGEFDLLLDALDSHKYWQLSDAHYRSSGYVLEPGADDPDTAAAIVDCDALASKLAGQSAS